MQRVLLTYPEVESAILMQAPWPGSMLISMISHPALLDHIACVGLLLYRRAG